MDQLDLHQIMIDHEIELEKSISISDKNIGVYHTYRQNLSLFIFSKLICHNMTIVSCFEKSDSCGLLDHFSIGTLGRAALDASLMCMYISDPVLTKDQWLLRLAILGLHDVSNRKRFFGAALGKKGLSEQNFFDDYQLRSAEEKTKIVSIGQNMGLHSDEIEKLMSGQNVYINGVNGAVKEAGWQKGDFSFYQSYFSAYVHSHPVSFFRANQHQITFDKPSEFQKVFSATVLSAVLRYLPAVNKRIEKFCNTVKDDHLGLI